MLTREEDWINRVTLLKKSYRFFESKRMITYGGDRQIAYDKGKSTSNNLSHHLDNSYNKDKMSVTELDLSKDFVSLIIYFTSYFFLFEFFV